MSSSKHLTNPIQNLQVKTFGRNRISEKKQVLAEKDGMKHEQQTCVLIDGSQRVRNKNEKESRFIPASLIPRPKPPADLRTRRRLQEKPGPPVKLERGSIHFHL